MTMMEYKCQIFHKILRWLIFSSEWMLSQIKVYQISCIDCIVTSRFGTNISLYFPWLPAPCTCDTWVHLAARPAKLICADI